MYVQQELLQLQLASKMKLLIFAKVSLVADYLQGCGNRAKL